MNAKSESQIFDTSPQRSAAAVAPVVRLSVVPRPVAVAVPQVTGLAAGQLASVDGLPGAVTLRFGSVKVTAIRHESVEPVVLRRAFERNETLAKHITLRASGVHKIIGRAIQLK